MKSRIACCIAVTVGVFALGHPWAQPRVDARHNIVLFVPDGLRALKVDTATAPAMAALRDRGVNFSNPHSHFPTVTTPNASAMATGHYLGDTGDFSNTLYIGFVAPSADTVTPFLENDDVLGDLDRHFGGNYLHEVTLLEAARAQGFSTAAIGKLGPTLIFDHRDRLGEPTIIIDDSTGGNSGVPLSKEMMGALEGAGLPLKTPSRGENARNGTLVANVEQQRYLVDVVTKVILPTFKKRGRPFLLVFWSRDPDGTQHSHGDSPNLLSPGINGATSLAAIKNADDCLARIQEAIAALGLVDSTNIIVSADHGFSTVSKQSGTSPAPLPLGFVARDIATTLSLPMFEPDGKFPTIVQGASPRRGHALIGPDPLHPDIVVAANGGSDLIYLPKQDKGVAQRVIAALLAQDYSSGIFVDDALGKFSGTLPLSAVMLKGAAATPTPSIIVGFRTWSTGCAEPVLCGVEIADTAGQQGQGMHGTLSRADTMNFQAAAGPDFKTQFKDEAPSSNADVGRTIAHLLGLKMDRKGSLVGRVLDEALVAGRPVKFTRATKQSAPSADGLRTVIRYQEVGRVRYLDAGGFPGRTLGLDAAIARPLPRAAGR